MISTADQELEDWDADDTNLLKIAKPQTSNWTENTKKQTYKEGGERDPLAFLKKADAERQSQATKTTESKSSTVK